MVSKFQKVLFKILCLYLQGDEEDEEEIDEEIAEEEEEEAMGTKTIQVSYHNY